MPPLMTLFAEFRGDDRKLQVDAVKAGEAAGMAVGLSASKTMTAGFKKGLPGALSSFGTGLIQGMGQEAWRGITGAIDTAVSAIPDLIERGKQYGLLIDDIADKTGATAESSSRLAGSLMFLGISTDGLGTNLRVLSKEITTNEAEFRRLGIATRDANGLQLDTVTILENVRRYLAGTADGADKLARASKLLGKSAGELIDWLNLTDDQAAALEDRLRSLGLIVGEEFRAESEKAKRASEELDLAFLGLGVTLQAELGPTVRSVVSGITQFIIDRAADIRAAIATVASAIAGLIAGITGIDLGTSFVDQLASLGGAPATATDKLNTRLAELNAQRDELIANAPKVTAGTNANTAAIERQTAAIDKQIAAIEREDKASETLFRRQLAGIAAVYQAQLDALDAAERAADLESERRDAAISLAEAEERLRTAQAKAATGEYDAAEVADAQREVLRARAAQAEVLRRQEADERRRRIEETKAYIESIADLEANAENRKALANTLANREKVLSDRLAAAQAAGDSEEVARLTSKLEAVRAAETRNGVAMRNETRKTELQKTKEELADLRKSITSNIGGGSSEASKKFQQALADINAEIAKTQAALDGMVDQGAARGRAQGSVRAPLGKSGTLVSGMQAVVDDWRAKGEDLKEIIRSVTAVIQTLIDKVAELLGALDKAALGFRYLTDEKFRNQVNEAAGIGAGTDFQNLAMRIFGALVLGPASLIPDLLPKGGKASGGFIGAGHSAWVGEAGMEVATALPGGGTWITPLAGGGGGMAPAVIRLEIGGRALMDYIDENLAYRVRR